MNLKNIYDKFLPIAENVAYKINRTYHLPQSMQEDILSTAQLNLFEFCNIFCKSENFNSEQTIDHCFNFVYKKVYNFYRAEIKQYYTRSTNAVLHGKDSEIGQLEDLLKSKEINAQDALEIKHAPEEIKKVFTSLSKRECLIFNSMLKNKNLQESQIALHFGITEKDANNIVNNILKKIFDEAGEITYNKYYHIFMQTKQKRFLNIISENWQYLPIKIKRILKARYVYNLNTAQIANKFGYLDHSLLRRTNEKIKILAGEFGEKEKVALLERMKKQKEQENFIKFIKTYEPCKAFFKTISKKRKDIFIRHYIKGETYLQISKDYNCIPSTIERICHTLMRTLKAYVYGNNEQKEDILTSLDRTCKFHITERVGYGINKTVRDFLKLKNYKDILSAFPKDDQIIINEYLIKGKTSAVVSAQVKLLESGVQQRGKLLAKKLEVFTQGTNAEQTRALQMLNKNHWLKHKIKYPIVQFMQHQLFNQIVSELPDVDQIILKKYFIDGQLASVVAKEINLGRTGLNYRAIKLLDAINIFNTGTPEEIYACLEKIKHTKISKAKIKKA